MAGELLLRVVEAVIFVDVDRGRRRKAADNQSSQAAEWMQGSSGARAKSSVRHVVGRDFQEWW
ncbi:hypothetical protein E5D57_012989 [Metarhizium anisopliae]|nr:hypothetical protein E5D57_012989 [Metarhizium anisopliae]